MSSSDPRDNPYGRQPGDDADRTRPPSGPSGPFGRPPGGTGPDKVNTIRLIVLVTSVVQALFSLLVMIAFAMAAQELEETYGDLEAGAGLYYTFFGASLIHAAVGILLAARITRGGIPNLRIVLIVWASFLVLLGLGAFPLGLLWVAVGAVCIVLLASPEARERLDRPRA